MNKTFPGKEKLKGLFFFLLRRTVLKFHYKKNFMQRGHNARRKTGRSGVEGKNREGKYLDDYQRHSYCIL